jgi:hypothetical protein
MLANQFQRNSVILGQRHDLRNGDTAAVSRGRAAGFTATSEIAAADKAGGWSGKKETLRVGTTIAPMPPFATLAARSTLAIPTCPRGRRGARERCSTIVTVNWRPNRPVGAGEAPPWALGETPRHNPPQPGDQGPARRPSELLTRPRRS